MLETKSQIITEDEAALYDRQIRLWGLDSQKRYDTQTSYWYLGYDYNVNWYTNY